MRTTLLLALACAAAAVAEAAPASPSRALARARTGRAAALAAADTADTATASGPALAARGGAASALDGANAVADRLITLLLLGLWYALNVAYNIINKEALNQLPLPYLMAAAQLGIGSAYVGLGWATGLRKRPAVDRDMVDKLAPVAACHGLGQLATVLSLGAGAVSFTHIVKAMEPFFSALLTVSVMKRPLSVAKWASLVPVVGGVTIAVGSDVSFGWFALVAAMVSNVCFAARAVFSKMAMGDLGKRASATNIYALVTILAFAGLLPVALLAEGGKAASVWQAASLPSSELARQVLLSGIFHYLNNEVMYVRLLRRSSCCCPHVRCCCCCHSAYHVLLPLLRPTHSSLSLSPSGTPSSSACPPSLWPYPTP